jgi:hypothetical protein
MPRRRKVAKKKRSQVFVVFLYPIMDGFVPMTDRLGAKTTKTQQKRTKTKQTQKKN